MSMEKQHQNPSMQISKINLTVFTTCCWCGGAAAWAVGAAGKLSSDS